MTITTQADALAKQQALLGLAVLAGSGVNWTSAGRAGSSWGAAVNGNGSGAYDTTLNGVVLTGASTAGAVLRSNPTGGLKAYLSRLSLAPAKTYNLVGGMVTLCDRLWHNGGISITSTGVQNITSPTWPARDIAGSTNGDGVLIALEVSAGTGVGVPTITVVYTNQAGVGSRSATLIDTVGNTRPVGSFFRFGLQEADSGVRSVQSIQLSATWTSGTINLVAYRPICNVATPPTYQVPHTDPLTLGFPQLLDDSVLFFIVEPINNQTGAVLMGSMVESWG